MLSSLTSTGTVQGLRLLSHIPTAGLTAAKHATALLSVLTLGATGKAYRLLHLSHRNPGIRKIRYLEVCLNLYTEINQLELVQPLMCFIKPSSALWLDPGPKNDFVFFFK